MDQPNIKFIEADSIQACEDKTNAWINGLPFLAQVLTVGVMPLQAGAKLVFVSIVTYVRAPSYAEQGGLK